METIIILLLANIIALLFGMKVNKIKSFFGFLWFRIRRYKLCSEEWIYSFTKKEMLKMNLYYKINIKVNKESEKFNADVVVYKNSIFIVLYGKWSNEQLKFAICHELSHIKLRHPKQPQNVIFISCLLMLSLFIYYVFMYVYPNIIQNKYKEIAQVLFQLIAAIIWGISFYIVYIIDKKRSRQNEKDADLMAARSVGSTIAIDAISMLNDKDNYKKTSSHPTNEERIKHLILNFNS